MLPYRGLVLCKYKRLRAFCLWINFLFPFTHIREKSNASWWGAVPKDRPSSQPIPTVVAPLPVNNSNLNIHKLSFLPVNVKHFHCCFQPYSIYLSFNIRCMYIGGRALYMWCRFDCAEFPCHLRMVWCNTLDRRGNHHTSIVKSRRSAVSTQFSAHLRGDRSIVAPSL